jgi:hypothetical protein
MSKPAFFTDEDIYAAVAVGLRKAGLDAVSTPEANRLGESDDSQLAWAAGQSRVLVTFNVAHFSALHSITTGAGQHHAGIVVSSQRPIGDMVCRLLHLADTLDATAMQDRLEFLGAW